MKATIHKAFLIALVILILFFVIVDPRTRKAAGDMIHDIFSQANKQTSLTTAQPVISYQQASPTLPATEIPEGAALTQSSATWKDAEKTASASSEARANEDYSYYAYNVLDGNPATTWTEAKKGLGFDEWVEISTKDGESLPLKSLKILNGYQRDSDIYFKNGRARRIRIDFSDGQKVYWELKDEFGHDKYQEIQLPENIVTSFIRITIITAYEGNVEGRKLGYSTDTCISDIIAE